MRFILFHGRIDSLNHFSDELAVELSMLGHEIFFVDCHNFMRREFEEFCSQPVHAAICFDGVYGDRKLFEERDIPIVNILMDHPMTFDYLMLNPLPRYIQLSPDEKHVSFTKRFYHIKHSYFLPHMGSLPEREGGVPYEERKYSLLFPGNFRSYNELYDEIKNRKMHDGLRILYMETLEYMLSAPEVTIEQAFETCIKDRKMELSDEGIAALLVQAKPLDEFIRMYWRYRVIDEISKAGLPITIMGEGWKESAIAQRGNVEILPAKRFVETFPFMEQSKILLNVMPWFKDGSHDRIFNALLRGACPLTDGSEWLVKNMIPDKDAVYYSLDKLDELPNIVYKLLKNDSKMVEIIESGCKKVRENYTRVQLIQQIFKYLQYV